MSSSVTVTVTVPVTVPKPGAAWLSVTDSPMVLSSSAAVAVTVCAVSQVIVVNVRLPGASVTAGPALAAVTVTLPVGAWDRRTV